MRETVEILRLFFKHEPVKYSGEIFKLERGFTLRFDPVRKSVPIYLATLNPKSVKMTAEIADGWMPVMIPIDQLAAEVTRVQQWVRDDGRDPKQFTVRAPGESAWPIRRRSSRSRAAARPGRSLSARAWASSTTGARARASGRCRRVRAAWAEGGPERPRRPSRPR
jgi:alkanesulfonate monooxygenase SsuD/methylene tetrahydromethanopterin reductase-like flavin-dependent oxidoreductase (luciferase family)